MRTRIYAYAFGSSLSIELGKRRYEFEGCSGEKGILHLREDEAIRLMEDHPMFKNGGIRFVEEVTDFYGAESYEVQTVRGMLAEALRQKYVAEKCEDEYRRRLSALLGEKDVPAVDGETRQATFVEDVPEEIRRLEEENFRLSEELKGLRELVLKKGVQEETRLIASVHEADGGDAGDRGVIETVLSVDVEMVQATSVEEGADEVQQFRNMQTLKGYLCTIGAKPSYLRTNEDIIKSAAELGVRFEIGN